VFEAGNSLNFENADCHAFSRAALRGLARLSLPGPFLLADERLRLCILHGSGIDARMSFSVSRSSADAWAHPELFDMDWNMGTPPIAISTPTLLREPFLGGSRRAMLWLPPMARLQSMPGMANPMMLQRSSRRFSIGVPIGISVVFRCHRAE
jgi:hypothetical protein